MVPSETLAGFLETWAAGSDIRSDVAATVSALVDGVAGIRHLIGLGPLDERSWQIESQLSGDVETSLDRAALEIFRDCICSCPAAAISGRHRDTPIALANSGRLLVAIDPLEGSSNIDANSPIGSIFSLLPRASGDVPASSPSAFCQSGEKQLAAGFIVYGPRTSLVLTLRDGTHVFTRDPRDDVFYLTYRNVRIPPLAREYAINASNYRHWDEATRTYVDDCLKGREGVRASDFNMRWIGSLVAEIYRIISRGGIYLYPADRRTGRAQGRLSLVHEANPIALIVENAYGAASTGRDRVLHIVPKSLDRRVPIVVGSRAEVDYVMRLYNEPNALGERSPLFRQRGLFRI